MNDQIREHLRLLSLFHYVVGGIGYLVSMIPFIHLFMGIFLLASPESLFPPGTPASPALEAEGGTSSPPPGQGLPFPSKQLGLMFTIMPAVMILCGFALSTAVVVAGRRLAAHRSHNFCFVVAAILCVFVPVGTVLGIFTILTLVKPEAKELFGVPTEGREGLSN